MHLNNDPTFNPYLPSDHLFDCESARELLGFSSETAADLLFSRSTGKAKHSDSYIDNWVADRLSNPTLSVEPVPLLDMNGWEVEKDSGNIRHKSGMFFSITGVRVRHRSAGIDLVWDQPIIDQPEIGILGIIAKKINGVLHFCLQAKEEPGNINYVQLSPTVQATYSNYTMVHGGTPPPFVKLFLEATEKEILYAKLQTEDGGRFLYKSNRNMIIQVGEDDLLDLPSGFIWLTLKQIAGLLKRNNLIHACTRSVLSSILLPQTRHKRYASSSTSESFASPEHHKLGDSLSGLIQWLDNMKANNHILTKREGLSSLQDWKLDKDGYFSHFEWRFFRIIGLDVTSSGREVTKWQQPILANPESGIIGLLTTQSKGERFFLMQAKAEVGNRNMVQLAPTVQFTPGNYAHNEKLLKPFLFDEFSGKGQFPVIAESFQAEEGARFFLEQHLHRILALPEGTTLDLPPNFRWISESQLRFFLHLGEMVNSCARSIISCLI